MTMTKIVKIVVMKEKYFDYMIVKIESKYNFKYIKQADNAILQILSGFLREIGSHIDYVINALIT